MSYSNNITADKNKYTDPELDITKSKRELIIPSLSGIFLLSLSLQSLGSHIEEEAETVLKSQRGDKV